MSVQGVPMSKKKWLFLIIRNDFKLLMITMLLGVLVSIMGLAVAVFSQKFIDIVIPTHDLQKLNIFLGITVGIILFKMCIALAQEYLSVRYNKKFSTGMIDQFFKRLLALPKSFYDKHDTGAIITRMNDTNAIQDTITYVANTLVLNTLILISSSVLLYYYLKPLAFMVWICLPIYIAIALIFKKETIDNFYRTMNASAIKESNFISTIKNADMIKVNNKQGFFSGRNHHIYGLYQDAIAKSGITGVKIGKIAEIFGSATFMFMLSFAAYQLMLGHITIGVFSAALSIASGMLGPLGSIGFAILHLQGARVAFDRMYEFVSHAPEYDEEEDNRKKHIDCIYSVEFKQVYFSYNPEKELLKNITFKVRKGEMLCFWGENGSGKSTILKLILYHYKPDRGNILFEGIDTSELSIKNLREKIGLADQQSKLFDLTVIENICLDTNPQVIEDAIEYLNSLGFDRIINYLPDGYQTMVHENGENLSGGQKQIIALARALNKRPDILILDEPSAALDEKNEGFVIDILKKFKQNGTVIIVTHKHNPAKESDTILLLKDGIIEQVGSHDHLVTGNNLYAKSYKEALTN